MRWRNVVDVECVLGLVEGDKKGRVRGEYFFDCWEKMWRYNWGDCIEGRLWKFYGDGWRKERKNEVLKKKFESEECECESVKVEVVKMNLKKLSFKCDRREWLNEDDR